MNSPRGFILMICEVILHGFTQTFCKRIVLNVHFFPRNNPRIPQVIPTQISPWIPSEFIQRFLQDFFQVLLLWRFVWRHNWIISWKDTWMDYCGNPCLEELLEKKNEEISVAFHGGISRKIFIGTSGNHWLNIWKRHWKNRRLWKATPGNLLSNP